MRGVEKGEKLFFHAKASLNFLVNQLVLSVGLMVMWALAC